MRDGRKRWVFRELIRDDMGFGTTHYTFWEACRVAVGMIRFNPGVVPGSLSNPELISEIKFWRDVSFVFGKLGFVG